MGQLKICKIVDGNQGLVYCNRDLLLSPAHEFQEHKSGIASFSSRQIYTDKEETPLLRTKNGLAHDMLVMGFSYKLYQDVHRYKLAV